MGIKARCKSCNEVTEFPNCPDAEIDKFEALAFSIYTVIGNEAANGEWACYSCCRE